MGFSLSLGSPGAVISALVGKDIVAKSISLTQAASSVAIQMVNGARLKLGTGTVDYLTSDGAGTITAAGDLGASGRIVSRSAGAGFTFGSAGTEFFGMAAGASASVVGGAGSLQIGSSQGTGETLAIGGRTVMRNTAPTITAGAGASIVASNGTAAFRVDLGGAAGTGTITLPAATTGWVLYMQCITNPDNTIISQTGTTTTTATFKSYSRTTGAAANWAANENATCIAIAY